MEKWIGRDAALALLGVKSQTLYAYVSRGQIEVRQKPGSPYSLYRSEDVAALAGRRKQSRKPSAIAARSMAWGEAAIVTNISTVHHGQLIYRGQDAAELARTVTFEETARLLWDSRAAPCFTVPDIAADDAFAALAALVPESAPALGRQREELCLDAQKAIAHIAASCGVGPGAMPLHAGLAALWSLNEDGADLIRQALVLVADHELNASTFAARVAASTGASIASCLLAGLCALSGPKHGGAAAALSRLLREAEDMGPAAAVPAWLACYGDLPGFGHPLYPHGDVRAAVMAEQFEPDPLLRRVQDVALEHTGLQPNIDYSLIALSRKLRLPDVAPFTIFLLGRSAGWAAHAMEQAFRREIIRPRGRYEGPRPPLYDV